MRSDLQSIQVNFFYRCIVSERLSQFHDSNLSDSLISCEFQLGEPAHVLLKQRSQQENTLVWDILVFDVESYLISWDDWLEKLFDVFVVQLQMQLILVDFERMNLGYGLGFGVDVLDYFFSLQLFFFFFAKSNVLVWEVIEGKVDLS